MRNNLRQLQKLYKIYTKDGLEPYIKLFKKEIKTMP